MLFKAWQLSNYPKNPSISSKPHRAYICTIMVEIVDSNVITDSSDMGDNEGQTDQNAEEPEDDCVLLLL
ncbi:hypothetical protein Tco_0641557 [Tanacetum coccineum]